MSDSTNSSICLAPQKNYWQTYKKNLVLGYNVGTATSAVNWIGAPDLYEFPLLNRLINLGSFNALQDIFFQRTNSDWKTNIDNFLYLGALQTIKFVPNVIVQNVMKKMLYTPEKPSDLMKFSKTFIIVSTGMKVFFAVGAIESKIVNEEAKINFVIGSFGVLLLTYLSTGPLDSKFIEKTKAIHLSPNGYMATATGLVGSFMVPDAMHRMGIDKGGEFEPNKVTMFDVSISTAVAIVSGFNINLIGLSVVANQLIINPLVYKTGLDEAKFFGYDLINMASLTIMSAASISQGDYVTGIATIMAFAEAKAEAVTGVEIANDNKEYICSDFIFKSACEYLGIVEHSAEVVL